MVVSIVIPTVTIVITTIVIVITTVLIVVPTLLPVIPTKTIVITTIYDDSIDGCNNSNNTYTDSNKVMRTVWIAITTVTKL